MAPLFNHDGDDYTDEVVGYVCTDCGEAYDFDPVTEELTVWAEG
jgi:hypothetical protein